MQSKYTFKGFYGHNISYYRSRIFENVTLVYNTKLTYFIITTSYYANYNVALQTTLSNGFHQFNIWWVNN